MKAIEKINPITNDLVSNWQTISKQVSLLEKNITNRIDYIVQTICKVFTNKLRFWHFAGAGEGEVGNASRAFGGDCISYVAEYSSYEDMVIVLQNGFEFGLGYEFPKRWLYEDFEEELIEGRKKYKEREKLRALQLKEEEEKQKHKQLFKYIKDVKIMEELKKKLSKEELEVLKRNL